MEEKKEGVAEACEYCDSGCEHKCGHTCFDVHRYCFKHFCLVRILGAFAVIIITFLIGFAAGRGERWERGEWGDRYQYGPHYRMMYWNDGDRAGNYGEYHGGNVQFMYRMMGYPNSFDNSNDEQGQQLPLGAPAQNQIPVKAAQ